MQGHLNERDPPFSGRLSGESEQPTSERVSTHILSVDSADILTAVQTLLLWHPVKCDHRKGFPVVSGQCL